MPKRKHGTKVIASKYFNGDIIITDPCYIIPDDNQEDWGYCEYGKDMSNLGISHCLSVSTLEGDWYCEVFKGSGSRLWYPLPPEKKIGEFSADACMVGVFYLHEILKYNPNYDDHIKTPWCACWIKDFQGTVNIVTKIAPDGEESMHVIGIGNKSFFSRESYWSEYFSQEKSENH